MQICCEIIEPPRPFALRLSSKLLLGVTRVFAKQAHYLLVDLRHALECIKKQNNNKNIDLPPSKAKNRSEAVTLSDPFAQFNAWLLSNAVDVLNSSISDFDFPLESEFLTITDSQTVDLKEITIEEEFLSSPISVLDENDDFGQEFVQHDDGVDVEPVLETVIDMEVAVVNSDPQNDSVLLYDELSGTLRRLEEVPAVQSPGGFELEEITSDHIQPLRRKKVFNPKPRDKQTVISEDKFCDCLRNPNDLLQSKSVLRRVKSKQLFDSNSFSLTNKGIQAQQLVDVWKRNAKMGPFEALSVEVPRGADDGSEASVEILRDQYSIDTAYEESREGFSQLSNLTPLNDQSSSLFSIPNSYEFEMTSSTQRYMPVVPLGHLSPILDQPELDMEIDDVSLPSLDDSDVESEASTSSTQSERLSHTFREIVHQLDDQDNISFSSLLPQPCLRKTAVKKFSQLLALTSKQSLDVHQDIPYGEIIIKRGIRF